MRKKGGGMIRRFLALTALLLMWTPSSALICPSTPPAYRGKSLVYIHGDINDWVMQWEFEGPKLQQEMYFRILDHNETRKEFGLIELGRPVESKHILRSVRGTYLFVPGTLSGAKRITFSCWHLNPTNDDVEDWHLNPLMDDTKERSRMHVGRWKNKQTGELLPHYVVNCGDSPNRSGNNDSDDFKVEIWVCEIPPSRPSP